MTTVIADERRERVAVDPDQRATEIARQSLEHQPKLELIIRGRCAVHDWPAFTIGVPSPGSLTMEPKFPTWRHIFCNYRMLFSGSAASRSRRCVIPRIPFL